MMKGGLRNLELGVLLGGILFDESLKTERCR